MNTNTDRWTNVNVDAVSVIALFKLCEPAEWPPADEQQRDG